MTRRRPDLCQNRARPTRESEIFDFEGILGRSRTNESPRQRAVPSLYASVEEDAPCPLPLSFAQWRWEYTEVGSSPRIRWCPRSAVCL